MLTQTENRITRQGLEKSLNKLNKSQLKEFAASGICEQYAHANFLNITRKYAERLLNATDEISRRLKGTALLGGWADYSLSTFKPKQPRTSQGKLVKYEALGSTRLIEVRHPDGVEVNTSITYIIEGFKKAVAVAQATGCRTFAFSGLDVALHLIHEINAFATGDVRIVFDNDNAVRAIDKARRLVEKLNPKFKIAKFRGFKGIDDALASGLTFDKVQFVKIPKWSASYSGYITSDSYNFDSPKFSDDIHIPESKQYLAITGGKGTGKTWFVEQLFRKLKESRNIFTCSHRRTLSRANAKRLVMPYIDDAEYQGGSCGFVIDSIAKIRLEDCIGACLFIDEICQVVEHLMHSDTLNNRKRQTVFNHLCCVMTRIIETGGLIVVADADYNHRTDTLMKALSGIKDDKAFLIKNLFVKDRGTALFASIQPTDVVGNALKSTLDGEKIYICCSARKPESKFSTTVLEQYFIDKGVPSSDICRIDAETVADKNHPAYQASTKINDICANYRVILASPTLSTGCDIQTQDFDKIYSIQSGSQRSDSARQATERVRDSRPTRIIYAPEENPIRKSIVDSKNTLDDLRESHNATLNLIDPTWFEELSENNAKSIIESCDNYWLKYNRELYCEQRSYAECIRQGMAEEGYSIKPFDSFLTSAESQGMCEDLQAISKGLVEGHRTAVEAAEIIDDEVAKALYSAEVNTVEDKQKLEAYQIRKRLGIEPTVEVQKAIDSGKKAQLENQFAALDGYELSQQLVQKAHFWNAGKADAKELTPDFIKRSARMIRIKALHDVDFFGTIRQEFDTQMAEELLRNLKSVPLNLKLFNLPKTPESHALKTIRAIAKQFNFNIIQTRKTQKRFYKAVDMGFVLSDSLDLKPQVFTHFTEKAQSSVNAWQAFKSDFQKVQRGQRLDEAKSLPALSDEFKYARLSTRARTLPPVPLQPSLRMISMANAGVFCEWLANQPRVAIDIETYGEGKRGGLNHISGVIRLIQFATTTAIWVCEKDDFKLIEEALKACLVNPKQRKIGHNFMFDLRFLGRDFGVIAQNCADTMLGSRCLLGDMGAAKLTSHSLQQACENFLGVQVDKSEQKSDWGGQLSESQIEYAAKDPWLTYLLYERLETLTKDPSLLLLPFPKMMAWDAWEVENRFLFAAQQMEDTGYPIDTELLANTKVEYQAVRDELMSKWDAPYSPTQKGKLQAWINEKYGLALKSLGKATAAENGNIPEIKLMQQICACDALLNAIGSIEKQVSLFGKVKPVFKTLTGTGRTSSGAANIDKCLLNLQSVAARVNPVLNPKKLNCKAIYQRLRYTGEKVKQKTFSKLWQPLQRLPQYLSKGKSTIWDFFMLPSLKALFQTNLIIDLPASHGRISAELGNDENALAAYMDKSIDMHCGTAAAVAQAVFPDENYTSGWIQANKGTDPIAKGLRESAKNTYYGWLNGAGVTTIQKQIKSNLQINADKPACQKALEGLQNVFAGTTNYAKGKLRELEENQFVVNGVVCGWMEFAGTYLCWRLGVVGGDMNVPATKAFAGIWSRAESLLMKRACARIAEKFASLPQWGAKLQNFIHDEINAVIGCKEAALFAHDVVREEFGRICSRTIGGFDPLEKCYPLDNWSQK